VITFDAVTKRFPDGTVAVDALSMQLPTGQITCLVGPSGCGKTTSLRMVNRMIDPTEGRILVDGEDIRGQDPSRLRLRMGYVIQHAGLFPHRTVLDNIATVPMLLGQGRRQARAAAEELIERVGLPAELAGRYPVQLSGGQQQRVGVARALAADPPVMLMDEPFSAVDPIVRGNLQQEFLRLQAELGKTIAFVTHDIDEAITLGDQVAVMAEGGHLVQLAPPGELLASPASEFVADFVGRDRGIRGLSFTDCSELPVQKVAAIVAGGETPGGWTLIVDEDGRPLGWTDRPGVPSTHELRPTGGSYRAGDPLRSALDLSLTSPAGLAIRVDDRGRADGVVDHPAIARHLAQLRSSSGGDAT
jgi:osmoprotectant transport system ATP-binding protein